MGGEKYTLSDELDKSARLATLAKCMETMKEKKKQRRLRVCLTLMKSLVQFVTTTQTSPIIFLPLIN